MNYAMFAFLAIMFIAYVFLKSKNKKQRRSSNGNDPDQRIKLLEEEIKKLKGDQS